MKKLNDRDLCYTLRKYFSNDYNPRANLATQEVMFLAEERIQELRKELTKEYKKNSKLREKINNERDRWTGRWYD